MANTMTGAGYTYDDFEKAANAAGLLGNFSRYDLDLARRYPEFGLSILSLKQDYGRASTDEARALANEAANSLRRSYGSYTGGADGSGFYSEGKLPGQIDGAMDALESYGPFTYGRESEYKQALDAVLGQEKFRYDPAQDPVWQAYRKQYAREGRRAGQDVMGEYAAMTGGTPSTAAVTAAQQAGDYYAAQAADKIPQLYQQAYERYVQEYQNRLSALSAMMNDRKQAQSEYLSDYDMLLSYLSQMSGRDDTMWSRAYSEAQAARNARQQALENELALAQLGASFGDYRGLSGLGITPNTGNVLAQALAEAGRDVPIGRTGSGGSGGAGTAAAAEPEAADPVRRFKDGDTGDDVIAALLERGFTQQQIEAAGYTGDYFKAERSEISDASRLGPRAQSVLRNAMNGQGNVDLLEYVEQQINDGIADGSILEEEASYILRALGFGG